MRIAIFHTEFVYTGGAERLVFEHYNFFMKMGLNPEIFATFVDYKKCYPGEIKNYKIHTFVPDFLSRLFPHEFLILLSFIFLPFYIFKLSKFDLIFAENQAGPWWAFLVSRVLDKKYVTYQSYPTTVTHPRKIDKGAKRNIWYVDLIIKVVKPLMIKFDKYAIRKAAVRFSCGIYTTKVCIKTYGCDFINCPGGTVLGNFNKNIFENRFKNPYILIVNRHFVAKELEWGIKALSVLKVRYNVKNLKLVITGSFTNYTRELISLAKSLEVSGNVTFTGLVKDKKWNDLYSGASVFLYTAPEEDFGLGVIEAMAHGVPVVAWNNAGPKYIVIDGKTGFLVKSGSPDDFTDKIYKLISNKKLNHRFAINSYEEALKYTWEVHNNIIWTTLTKYSLL